VWRMWCVVDVVCDEWMWCGVEGRPEANRKHLQTRTRRATFAHAVRTVQHTTRAQPRHLGVGEQQITRAPETETERESKTAANTTERGSNRIVNGSRPDSKIASAHHTHIHALSALLSQRGHASGRAGRAATGIARRRAQSAYIAEQQGAARGGAGHGRRGRAVAACWQQCWQTGRCWTCCAAGSQLQSRSCEEFLHHAMCGRCAVRAARSHGPLLVLLC
jgi:hypothetical protein